MSITKSVLIVGANRGIGLNLVKAFIKNSWNVTGSIRPQSKTDASVKDLEATGAKILEIGFLNEIIIADAAKDFGNQRLDVLLNVGGLPPKPKSWLDQTPELFTERFQVMAVGPFLTIKHFLPNLEKSNTARVVNISSAFGSVTVTSLFTKYEHELTMNPDNTFGNCMAYRAAKSALNQITMTYARELEKEGKNITFVCMEPGFLPTQDPRSTTLLMIWKHVLLGS
ncbi:hypothetical protein EAF04_000056 [Stromatinia cepivora]|nr:hypothetical protein EAF04_000056 [Stromatinia cepivora]